MKQHVTAPLIVLRAVLKLTAKMKPPRIKLLIAQLLGIVFCITILSLDALAVKRGYQPAGPVDLFESDEILELMLEGDINELMNDRGEDPSYHLMKLHYSSTEDESVQGSLDLRVRVRGNFRRLKENCDRPPLKFNFKKHEAPEGSIFQGQSELKLVVPCQGEEYVIREYFAYKTYSLLTDYSFRVRLVRLTYYDVNNNRTTDPEFGFLIEDTKDMATRNQATVYKGQNLRPENLYQPEFLVMSVFDYMIGNTDWSIQYHHNVKLILLENERVFVPVPYDFDLTGIVSSPYAKPAEELKLRSVRERVYRGYCLEDLNKLNPILDRLRILKPQIYAIYTEAEFLERNYVASTINYLDDFYEVINHPKKRSKAFSYPCKKSGTGNIVISGLRNG